MNLHWFGRILKFLFPGLISRMNQQVAVVRKIKRQERMDAIKPEQGISTPQHFFNLFLKQRHKEKYRQFYNRIRFPWDPKAKDL